jgi:predicted permease
MSPRSITLGLRRLFARARADRELDDEVAHYIEMATEAHVRAGVPRREAERRARVEFGGVESAKEAVRSAGWDGMVEAVWRDIVYGTRALRRSAAFTIVAVLTLALGIGANTAMFSVVDAVMLRPLPYRDAKRIALVWTDDVRRGLHQEGTAYRTIEDWRAANRSFEELAYFNTHRTTLAEGGVRERSRAALVSGNLFHTLGVQPALGRTLTAADEANAEHVVVISYALWQRHFAGAPDVVGKSIHIDDVPKEWSGASQIVGVMPPGFYFPDKLTELWTPATTYWRFRRESSERFPSWARRWIAVGRLEPNVSPDAARADLAAIGQRISSTVQSTVPDFPGFTPNVVPVLDYVAGRNLQFALWVLLGAVGLVLLVSCANVANLMLARAATRRQEFAVRRALGAGRGRLVRQLAVESTLLALAGGAAGLFLAFAGTRVLSAVAAARIPRIDEIGVDARVMLFAVAASLAAGLVFGIVPAVRLSGADAGEALKENGRASGSLRMRRTRGLLVVLECSVAIVLLAGAGLLLRSLDHVRSVAPGFEPVGVLMVRMEFPPEPVPAGDERATEAAMAGARAQGLRDLTSRLAGMPGVHAVGLVDDMFNTGQGNKSITIGGRSSDSLAAGELEEGSVTPEFFATMRVPLRRGRLLTREDANTKIRALYFAGNTEWSLAEKEAHAVHEPVVVNEAFVKRFFPGENPVGKTFCIDPTNKTYWYVIVGVVGDMHRQGLERAAIAEYYTSYVPSPGGRADLLVRTTGDPLAAAATVRQTIASVYPRAIIPTVSTVDRQLGDFGAQRSFQTWLLTLFAALAVVLAAVGIYGVVHYAVAERTREIGVRMALGAAPSDVLALILRQGVRLPVLGIVLGLIAAAALGRLMSHLVFGVGSTDPTTFAVVGVALFAVAFVACYFPGRRATRVDPVSALRRE